MTKLKARIRIDGRTIVYAGNIGKPELRPELRPATTGATTRPSVRASEIVRPILKHADVKTEEDDVDDDDIALLRT